MTYKIVPDQPVTRRKFAHFIVDCDGEILYSSPSLKDCLNWLRERHQYSWTVDLSDEQVTFDLRPI